MTNCSAMMIPALRNGLRGLAFVVGLGFGAVSAAETTAPVSFSGGHETDPKDGGRPVVLVAAGLEVKPEVFREAFRGVTPAKDGKPSPEHARQNKAALMKVLKPLGVTNDRLDEVSNYYRYQPQKGDLWPTAPAKAHAIIEDGKIKQIVVTEAGSGYSSPPTATVKGMEKTSLTVTLQFGKDLKTNGGVASVSAGAPKASGKSQ
ncbi:hypothetical protein [Zavarzinella formosa]|uniref:hypothetical protein n=1 Tax=Zavarzinella formosa TaxID=360055 RepID=UPI0002F634DA|nr:hypothetical protein [Zavarzinella formosa]